MALNEFSSDLETKLLHYSRSVLEEFIISGNMLSPLLDSAVLKEKRGIFCTLRKKKQLRGCIGFPYPTHPLGEALVKSTIQAAAHDPRFKSVAPDELKDITIELTILTSPELIIVTKPEDYFKEIELGKDGLIIESNHNRGLLLPQVPIEQEWTIQEFLEGICNKAYLPTSAWIDIEHVKLFKFQGKIISESEKLLERA